MDGIYDDMIMSVFWFLDVNSCRCLCRVQVIFITEYMSSGSLKQFLKKTKKNHKTMNEKV